jgi:hypothetical protein
MDIRSRAISHSGSYGYVWSDADEETFQAVYDLINNEMDQVAADRAIEKILRGE